MVLVADVDLRFGQSGIGASRLCMCAVSVCALDRMTER